MTTDDIDWDAIEIQLLPEERKLLLKYGYPFDDARQQLERIIKSKKVFETLVISRYYLNLLNADICNAINKRTKGKVQSELLELSDRLDYAERWGSGELDIMW